jgi:4-amino-4-deoxychorismate lyase
VSEAATLIDGRPGDQVSVAERALQYGDGLFETISCVDGTPRWLPLHLQRLRRGCERLRLSFTDYTALTDEVTALAAAGAGAGTGAAADAETAAGTAGAAAGGAGRSTHARARCLVKVIVSRGVALRRGYGPTGAEQPTRIVSRHEWPAGEPDRPLQVSLSSVRLGTNPLLAGLKHLNRLEQVLAQLARPAGIDEVLMLSSRGEIIGGSMSNVFFADDTGLFTPRLDACGVAGVMRGLVLQTSKTRRTAGVRMHVHVRRVMPAELALVREAFVTNVRWGIRSIGSLDGRPLGSDDYAQQLRRWMDAAQS